MALLVRKVRRGSATWAFNHLGLPLDENLEVGSRGRGENRRRLGPVPEALARPALNSEHKTGLRDTDDEKDGSDEGRSGGRIGETDEGEGGDKSLRRICQQTEALSTKKDVLTYPSKQPKR